MLQIPVLLLIELVILILEAVVLAKIYRERCAVKGFDILIPTFFKDWVHRMEIRR